VSTTGTSRRVPTAVRPHVLPLDTPARAALRVECRGLAVDALAAVGRHDAAPAGRAFIEQLPVAHTRRLSCKAGSLSTLISAAGQVSARLSVNVALCHTDERYRSTLLHELAHAVVFWVWRVAAGQHFDAHGPEWRDVMRRMGESPDRCHAYDLVEAFPGRVTRYLCGCGKSLTLLPRHRLRFGERNPYYCKRCRRPIGGTGVGDVADAG
jgi:predicted SprT family Zn-dependent metalloprotease